MRTSQSCWTPTKTFLVTKAAVFCAMDYLDEYNKSTGSAENMRSQIQDYIADAARAKLAEDKVENGE